MARVRQPPSGVELSPLLTVRGREGAHRWIATELRVPLKLNYVRAAATRGDIPSRRIGAALYFSTQDLFDWVVSLADMAAS